MLKLKSREQVLQRSVGLGKLSVSSRDNGTWLETLHQKGSAKIRLPKTFDSNKIEAVMINTAGGVAGGDELSWKFQAKENSNLCVTSQACERFYRAGDEVANVDVSLKVGANAHLHWLPQETILFDGMNAKRTIEVDLENSAKLLMCEAIIFGRKAMNETVMEGTFSDRWRVSMDGVLIHAEDLKFQGDLVNLLQNSGVMGDNVAIANLLLIDDFCEGKLIKARQIIGANGGASFWHVKETGKLVARVIAKDSYVLRKTLIPLLGLLMDDVSLPKVWAT